MIQYIFSSLFFFFLVLFAYIKIRYPFWNNQPVFHTYDYWRYFYSIPYIIYKYRPVKTKYCDFHQVETTNYSECSQHIKTKLVNLLQCYYIPSEKILHTITEKEIDTLLTGTNEPCYVSLFHEKVIQNIGEQEQQILINPEPSGGITSRPYKIFYRPTLSEPMYTQDLLYFIDYLCVKRERDAKKLSRVILQTHEYNQRRNNPNVLISLIKKEIDLFEGVIPFVKYNSITYYIPVIQPLQLLPDCLIIKIGHTNISMLTDFLYNLTHNSYENSENMFDLCILQDTAYYLSQIKAGILHVYCLQCKEHVYGVYFFKNTYTEYEDIEGNVLMFSSSIKNIPDNNLFYSGFINSVYHIMKEKKQYKMLMIENIGHNSFIIPIWNTYNTPIFNNDTAYYLYNFIYPSSPLLAERSLILT
jgi:hypothetical protein